MYLVKDSGLGDTNLARLQTAKLYLNRCDQVLIVNKINRAVSSANIRDTILSQEAQGLVGRGRILTVVCTGSEVRKSLLIELKALVKCCRISTPNKLRGEILPLPT